MQPVNLGEIKQKLNNKRAIIEFFMEAGYYYPPFSSYNYQFCLQVLQGKKKVNLYLIISFYYQLLKLGEIGGYDLPYFSKDKFLTKNYIISQFTNDIELVKYLPDQVSPSTVTRSFLLALLFNVRKQKYFNIYTAYKDKKKQSSTTGGKLYTVPIAQSFLPHIKNYISSTK